MGLDGVTSNPIDMKNYKNYLMIECWNGPLLEDDDLGADSPEVGVLGKELLGWSSRTIQTILLHISK